MPPVAYMGDNRTWTNCLDHWAALILEDNMTVMAENYTLIIDADDYSTLCFNGRVNLD